MEDYFNCFFDLASELGHCFIQLFGKLFSLNDSIFFPDNKSGMGLMFSYPELVSGYKCLFCKVTDSRGSIGH
jgi:hypothetical protein